jgi:hypothetical protein
MPLYQPNVRTEHFVKQTKVELKGAKLNFEDLLMMTSVEGTTRYKYSVGGRWGRPQTCNTVSTTIL